MPLRKPLNSNIIAAVVTACFIVLFTVVLSTKFGQLGGGAQLVAEAMDEETFLDLEDLMLEDFEFTTKASPVQAESENQLANEPATSTGLVKPANATSTNDLKTPIDTPKEVSEALEPLEPQKPPVAEIKIDSVKTVLEVDSAIADLLTMMSDANKSDKTAKSTSQKTAKERLEFYKSNYRLIRNFQKVYPYALKTRQVIEMANAQLASTESEIAKKKLIKQMEDDLFAEYEGAVRKMSVSQGKLLLKLIARETNKTGYELIKEYRGAFSASFWYGVGKIFGTDLKTKYDQKEDSVIETVLDKYKKNELY